MHAAAVANGADEVDLMANSWLRLWHDMPNDPKFRVVAKSSGQPVSLVMAVYVAILVDASTNKSRGVTQCHDEDLSVTVDCDIAQIEQIKHHMQGRLLDGNNVKGWENRQPKREDSGDDETGAKSAAERQAAKRERDRIAKEEQEKTQSHDESRKVTLDKDKDKDKEEDKNKDVNNKADKPPVFNPAKHLSSLGVSDTVITGWLAQRKSMKAAVTEAAILGIQREAEKANMTLDAALLEGCSRGWKGFKAEWMRDNQQARASPGYKNIHDQRAETIAALTGRNRNERTTERDITGESRLVA